MPEPTDQMMTLDQAERLALDLMREHGLIDAGWTFRWTRGKRRLGVTEMGRRRDRRTGKMNHYQRIGLSRHLVELNPEPVVRDVILHEVAHALAGIENGHNDVWKAICKRIGAKPDRLAGEDVEVTAHRYSIVCDTCGEVLTQRDRRPTPSVLARSHCGHCGPSTIGQLRVIENS